MSLTRDFAGAERQFRLGYGEIMDIEEACGKAAIGAIYKRLGTFDWRISEVFNVVKRALVGGGMAVAEADRLVRERVEAGRLGELVTLALDIMLETVEGAPPGKGGSAKEPQPFDRGLVYKTFAEVGIAPQDVDAMGFSQVLQLFEAMGRGDRAEPLTDDEFAQMRARVASGALDWSLQPSTKDDAKAAKSGDA